MLSPINNIVRSASHIGSLNILSFIYDGHFETTLCEAFPQHNFYGPLNDANPPTTWNLNLYPQPDNFTFIPNLQSSNLAAKLNLDLVLCHDRGMSYDIAKQYASLLHINIIILEHIANTEYIDIISFIPALKKTKNDTNVFINNNVATNFQLTGEVIPYTIPTIVNTPCDKKEWIAIDVSEDMINNVQEHLQLPINNYKTDILDWKEYCQILQRGKFFLNFEAYTTHIQPSILHAMASGCIVISMPSPIINEIITHGENGFIVSNMQELIGLANNLDTIDLKKIQHNSIEYIKTKFNQQSFQKQWNKIFTSTHQKVYIR